MQFGQLGTGYGTGFGTGAGGYGTASGGFPQATRAQRFRQVMDERGVQYAEDWFSYSFSQAALAHGATKTVQINIQRDSVFEALMLTGTAAAPGAGYTGPLFPITLQLVDSVSSKNLMSAPVPIANIIGTGGLPFVLPIPRRFMPTTQITAVLTSYAAADAISAYISLVGRKLFQAPMPGAPLAAPILPRFSTWTDQSSGKLYAEDLYMYDFFVNSLAAAASIDVTNIIEADSDFEWISTTGSALAQAGDTCVGADQLSLTLQVTDGGSQRQLLNTPTLLGDVCGFGQYPFILKQSRMFLAKTPVTLSLANVHPANTYTKIHITLVGRKIFEMQAG